MELTKQAISKYKTIIPGIEGYLLLTDKIDSNLNTNPDISIEACKSLIEGLCIKALSLLSLRYIASNKYRNRCKNNLTFLTATAFDLVYSNKVESDMHVALSNLVIDVAVSKRIKERAKSKVRKQVIETVDKIAALRHERGDISHGRNYPKKLESSIELAKSISSIVDGICSFMINQLKVQYEEKLKDSEKLVYTDLDDFNNWLNEEHNLYSVKIDFSKILYENEYEKYEEFFYLEYLEIMDERMDAVYRDLEDELGVGEVEVPFEEVAVNAMSLENDFYFNELKNTPNHVLEICHRMFNPDYEIYDTQKPLEVLVNTFDASKFWNSINEKELVAFSEAENLDLGQLKGIIEEYFYTNKRPLRDDVVAAMNIKPTLKNRKSVSDELTSKIINLADNLK